MTTAERSLIEKPLVRAEGIAKTFGHGAGSVQVLRGASLTIQPQSLVAIRGRSGSGKTTLINILGALDRPTEGKVHFKGTEIGGLTEYRRNKLRRTDIGLIFQSFALVPMMSAFENVEFGLRIAGIAPDFHREYAERALELVGLKGRMKHRPFEMSGGEQQRVAIARAIAHKPSLILSDEPTAELDSKMGLQVMKVFMDLVKYEGLTVVLTTHDAAIMEIVDHVYALEDGRIAEER
ncbi:ABC transporter ATP-binding protein [Paenibacillus arenilitoris]|uniref:ABC transporter ATP-binding protein n=1 Tax=Paenibacillus arenilitoris TaxID=2772299 RepID=A0A927H534_9BACL|nr:ABC transporter ATP-binding protein [Paenibacillus arenilitoris]MBD2868520.1 ABC transporter ATP-binding protein [Paenibacillus arenilitoris]